MRNPKASNTLPVATSAIRIERRILILRGHKVILDRDLAALYGVETRAIVQAAKRNPERFPTDFSFRLTKKEADDVLRSQFVILEKGGHFRHRPYAFTEQGVAMLSSLLRSEKAIRTNVAIMRAFVRIRQLAEAHGQLTQKLENLERATRKHSKAIRLAFDLLRKLLAAPEERD